MNYVARTRPFAGNYTAEHCYCRLEESATLSESESTKKVF